MSLVCIGNRVYTGLGEDELYFVVCGKELAKLADALDVVTEANHALGDYAQGRSELASAWAVRSPTRSGRSA